MEGGFGSTFRVTGASWYDLRQLTMRQLRPTDHQKPGSASSNSATAFAKSCTSVFQPGIVRAPILRLRGGAAA
jgi:hypothetical protein